MKNYKEMAQDALERIGEYETARKKRNKKITGVVTAAVCFCLVSVVSVGILKSGVLNSEAPIAGKDNQSEHKNGTEENNIPEKPDENNTENIIIGEKTEKKGSDIGSENDFCRFWWKQKLWVGGPLYNALEENPDGRFAVLAVYRPVTSNITSFIYEDKSLAEWAIEAENERLILEKMLVLLKSGDDLKFGTALYETGNASGEKWNKTFYEQETAYIGEELINKYIVDGVFLRDELEKDIAAIPTVTVTDSDGQTTVIYAGENAARKKYGMAYNAYLETVLPAAISRLQEQGITCKRALYANNGISLVVTADELENLDLENRESWVFDLDSGDLKGTTND